jgi:hypothetical protein
MRMKRYRLSRLCAVCYGGDGICSYHAFKFRVMQKQLKIRYRC